MPLCHRLEQKVTYQRRMFLALLFTAVCVCVFLSALHVFVRPHIVFNEDSPVSHGAGAVITSGVHVFNLSAISSFGRSFSIVSDSIVSDSSADTTDVTGFSDNPSGSISPIHTDSDILRLSTSFNSDIKFVISPPPVFSAPTLPWDQSRPPSVKSKTEPEGIHDIVAMRVLVDSLGQLTPFNNHPRHKRSGAEYYQLRRGRPGDAETIYRSLQHWTFYPALDERGHPVEAFLTITLIPRDG